MGLDIKLESIKCRAHRGADAARGAGGLPLIESEIGRGVRLSISGAVDPHLAVAVTKALPRR